MSNASFAACMKHVLVYEGGKVDHPRDPGGRTNQGVIQRVYNGWRKRNGLEPQDVYKMTNKERDAIYREGYWDQVRGDELPAGIDLVVFDGAVNSGPSQSVKWLQRALMMTRIDGVMGPATLAAIDAHKDHDMLVKAICDRRLNFLQALKTWSDFGRGWTSRVSQVRKTGQAWATGSVGPVPVSVEAIGGNRKAPIEDAKPLATKTAADGATGAGVATGGVAATLQQTKEAIEPYAGSADWINHVLAALAVLTALLVIGGLGYRWLAARKAHAQADVLDLPSGVTA